MRDTALYTDHIAQHYAAYRPPLHRVILERIIGDKRYNRGLDIGCGTGYSSLALLPFVNEIIAIDPSHEMLDKAIPKEHIEYYHFDKEHLDFKDQHFDIITLAGSLFYGKSQVFLDEISRVAAPGGLVLVYDFNIHLASLQALFPLPEITEYYDHATNFGGLNLGSLEEVDVQEVNYNLVLTITELAHLLLSDEPTYKTLTHYFGSDRLQELVATELEKIYDNHQRIELPTTLYWSIYKK